MAVEAHSRFILNGRGHVYLSFRGGAEGPPETNGINSVMIEDYGFIGDMETSALVSRDGSIDWLCFPRIDSPSCFAALLGGEEFGRWLITPVVEPRSKSRRYREGTLILESDFENDEGNVRLTDCMPLRESHPTVVRTVTGMRGSVRMRMELLIRFDYGSTIPWVRRVEEGLICIGGPNALILRTGVPTRGQNLTTVADFTIAEGECIPFTLAWFPSNEEPPAPVEADGEIAATEEFWRGWSSQCRFKGEGEEAVIRSLITLKGLTYAPTGGILAAATTSLPEKIGGVRNWDYRYCWLRDATFTLYALLGSGYRDEATAWRDWLVRAIAGSASQMQTLYGAQGERRINEFELPELPGFEGSAPVRIGNAAAMQFQLDVYGEVMDCLYQCRRAGIHPEEAAWRIENGLMEFLESNWSKQDEGIWEVRGERRHFTHSKVMAWVAMDRAVKSIENFGMDGDARRWKAVRQEIHDDVCRNAYHTGKGCFTQYYGSDQLDAALLMIPLVGFLPMSDPRVLRTIAAVERELMVDGFVYRYHPGHSGEVDGLPPGEGVFLPCSFWLADCLNMAGRREDALVMFHRLLDIRNDLGLLAEEYDPVARRLVGNFPQAFSHVGLINTATNLAHGNGPAKQRCH